jgi:predicted transcriptional regulator
MVRKKYLRRSMLGNACLFEPRLTRDTVYRRMLGDLVNRVFDGSAKAVVLSLFDCAEIDPSELKELRRLIADKSKEQKK